jgi:hypothetical protein
MIKYQRKEIPFGVEENRGTSFIPELLSPLLPLNRERKRTINNI